MDLMNLSDKDMDKIIKESDKEIRVMVGEGDYAFVKKHTGPPTIKAIRERLDKEIEELKTDILSFKPRKKFYDWDELDIFMQIMVGNNAYSFDWTKETWWLS